jgi:hypothetical protein
MAICWQAVKIDQAAFHAWAAHLFAQRKPIALETMARFRCDDFEYKMRVWRKISRAPSSDTVSARFRTLDQIFLETRIAPCEDRRGRSGPDGIGDDLSAVRPRA